MSKKIWCEHCTGWGREEEGVWDVSGGELTDMPQFMLPNLTFENSPKKVKILILEVEE